MKAFSLTDIGKKRSINQDYIHATEDAIGNLPNLFIVADGMGGHNAGDFASRCCVETLVETISKSEVKTPIGIMNEAIKAANSKIISYAEANEELQGMGTTVVVATIIDDEIYVANVGDSRLYVINDVISQITEDHSIVEEMVRKGQLDKKDARLHPNKNVITRALGAVKTVVPDYFEVSIKKDDYILMCSDGLTNMIDDEEIRNIIISNDDILNLPKELVDKANQYGGKDNISVVIIKV